MKELSLVIPLYNEDESLRELHDWIVQVMRSNDFTYEIVFVDDGSTDDSWSVIQELKSNNENVKGIRFRRELRQVCRTTCGVRAFRWRGGHHHGC